MGLFALECFICLRLCLSPDVWLLCFRSASLLLLYFLKVYLKEKRVGLFVRVVYPYFWECFGALIGSSGT
jgi:hypothetical protein